DRGSDSLSTNSTTSPLPPSPVMTYNVLPYVAKSNMTSVNVTFLDMIPEVLKQNETKVQIRSSAQEYF
ncbi:hypothetical protein BgiMline_028409, partial [Biomphalaria glabrata]